MRRKGEKRLEKTCSPSVLRAIERTIATGDHWFQAWLTQMSTTYSTIERKTGLAIERIHAIGQGAPPTDAEIERLATLWKTTPDVVMATMPPRAPEADGTATV